MIIRTIIAIVIAYIVLSMYASILDEMRNVYEL